MCKPNNTYTYDRISTILQAVFNSKANPTTSNLFSPFRSINFCMKCFFSCIFTTTRFVYIHILLFHQKRRFMYTLAYSLFQPAYTYTISELQLQKNFLTNAVLWMCQTYVNVCLHNELVLPVTLYDCNISTISSTFQF